MCDCKLGGRGTHAEIAGRRLSCNLCASDSILTRNTSLYLGNS